MITRLEKPSADFAARRRFRASSFQVMTNAADVALAVKRGKADAD